MGCACGGGKNHTPTYIHQAPNGSTATYRTEVEAKAAVIKHGGSYRIM